MIKPKLVVMAAGLGSRYGGLKQMENMTKEGEIILDFSCFDAIKAGFKDIVFIIKPEMEEDFKSRVISRISKYANCEYVFQNLHDLPEGFTVPEGRTKPWGTCHAVLSSKELLKDTPFCVINSDDYYGFDAFKKVYDFLTTNDEETTYCMAGYLVENTLSDLGTVTRGVCTSENEFLTKIHETKEIGKNDDGTISSPLGKIEKGTLVSMNFWGFKPSFIKYMEEDFIPFLNDNKDPLKSEFLLPIEVEKLLREEKCKVKVLPAYDKWYGVTYKEDKIKVEKAFNNLKVIGKYPEKLWDKNDLKCDLSFGTAGLRGIMVPGSEGINFETISLATVGLSKYLLRNIKEPRVAISYDSRNNSKYFAEVTLKTFKALGVNAEMFKSLTPVPILSYTIRKGKYDAGVMITASHNPKEYNGYKVYGSNGGQILEEMAKDVEGEILKVQELPDISDISLSYINEEAYLSYMKDMNKASNFTDLRNIHILYTPLYGSGAKPVTDMLKSNKFKFTLVEEELKANGDFPTCPYPNPEIPDVYEVAKSYAGDYDIIIATDPDCDRVGAMVNGTLLTGNDIGTILTYYLCDKFRKGTIVCSLVSTPLIEEIAQSFNMKTIRTNVGFKHIGDQIDLNPDFLFGFEESNGYLVGDYARDKDGVLGVKLLAMVTAYYKEKGMTLLDVLDEISRKYRKVINRTISVIVDPKAEKPEMKVINYDDKSRVIVRPSGTEPKIKYYISASSEERINELLNENMPK